jgi:hypothetical protein
LTAISALCFFDRNLAKRVQFFVAQLGDGVPQILGQDMTLR